MLFHLCEFQIKGGIRE